VAAVAAVTVRHIDGTTVDAPITGRVTVNFERHWQVAAREVFTSGNMEHNYWLAWQAVFVAKKTALDFDQWLDTVATMEWGTVDLSPL